MKFGIACGCSQKSVIQIFCLRIDLKIYKANESQDVDQEESSILSNGQVVSNCSLRLLVFVANERNLAEIHQRRDEDRHKVGNSGQR